MQNPYNLSTFGVFKRIFLSQGIKLCVFVFSWGKVCGFLGSSRMIKNAFRNLAACVKRL